MRGRVPMNRGLLLRTLTEQKPCWWLENIDGLMEVLDAGSAEGQYAPYQLFYSKFVGRGAFTAEEILADPEKPSKLTYAFVSCAFTQVPGVKAEVGADAEVKTKVKAEVKVEAKVKVEKRGKARKRRR